MEVTLELVERLREHADVSFGDAKAALEHTGGDLLEALIWLERQGKIGLSGVSRYQTGPSAPDPDAARYDLPGQEQEGFWRRAWRVLTENRLECVRGETRLEVPLAVLIALLVFAAYVVIGLWLLGFCFGWRYRFAGPQLGKKAVNDVMDRLDGTAADLRETVRKKFRK